MATKDKFRGNVYNQQKPQPLDEFADAMKQSEKNAAQDDAQEDLPREGEHQSSDQAEQTQQQQDLPATAESQEPQQKQPLLDATEQLTAEFRAEDPKTEAVVLETEQPATVIPPTQKEEARIMKSVERDLVSYMEAVHPKQAISEETGGAWQSSLYQTLKRILANTDPEVFKVEWNTLLAFFHKHADELFNENFMFRFQSTWKGSAKDFTAFRHLVFLAMRTANPQTRQTEARAIVLERIAQGLPAQAGTNLVNFYS